jgi:hypothetical protein
MPSFNTLINNWLLSSTSIKIENLSDNIITHRVKQYFDFEKITCEKRNQVNFYFLKL